MNINQIMKQAQQMQKKLADAQAQIEAMEVEGTSGGGMVSIKLNGKGHAVAGSLKVDPKLIDPTDPDMLCDLIVAAINNAAAKKDEESGKKMSEVSGGMNLPAGFKLPF